MPEQVTEDQTTHRLSLGGSEAHNFNLLLASDISSHPNDDGEDQGESENGQSASSCQSNGKRKVSRKNRNAITANVAGAKFDILHIVINEMAFRKTWGADEANLIWTDSLVQHEKITELRNYQRINHYPGMSEICRKDLLARNMAKMIKCQPQEYSFIPRTWNLTTEYTQFQNYVKEQHRNGKQKTFIIKPSYGAEGRGIYLIRKYYKLPVQEHFIAQEYLDKPFLVEGYKFDLRIYVLVTSCDPLRIYLYNDGLVRMCTEKYHPPNEANLSQHYMHLTNYSVNRQSENFMNGETADKGSKRSIGWFIEFLRANSYNVATFWGNISELVVKSLIVAEPHLLHAYRRCRPGQPPGSGSVCFEVLGFDILLDHMLKPWLLEINRTPSFRTHQKIDYDVKKGVLLSTLKLLNIKASDRKCNLAQQREAAQRRLYLHDPTKKLSATSSDREKQQHMLTQSKERLKDQQAAIHMHEQQNLGNYRCIYPPDDKKLLKKYDGLLSAAFQTFQAGGAAVSSLTIRTQIPEELSELTSGSSTDNSYSSSEEEEEMEGEERIGGGGICGGLSLTNGPSADFQSSETSMVCPKKKCTVTAYVGGTRFEIIQIVITELAFLKTWDKDKVVNLIWKDAVVQKNTIAQLKDYQRINHYPGMGEICQKDLLARNMAKMLKCQPHEYSFTPKVWVFPAEYTQFQNYTIDLRRKHKKKTFIVKPVNEAEGRGIYLIRNCEKIPAHKHLIVQEYFEKPFLLEGYKFDLRIYVLVTSCDPLRIFLYNDGLVRMCTEKYRAPNEANMSQHYMHLTNYSVNRHNKKFTHGETADKGNKRSISWFIEFLRVKNYDVAKFWGDISELVVKTLIVAEPHVSYAYRMCRPGQPPGSDSVCFEVLGFDIILDRKLKPWLLEINRTPSFGTKRKVDYDVKKGMLFDALTLLNIKATDKKRNLVQQKVEAQTRLYGHGSVKRLSANYSGREKQKHMLEKRKKELKEHLAQVQKQISREEHEKLHLGNYQRIYPPDDKFLLEKYERLQISAFQTFLGRGASLQKAMNNPLKRLKEEEILELLCQCERDYEKLMGKEEKKEGEGEVVVEQSRARREFPTT